MWLTVFSIDDNLHIIACDVGQGDAILIQKKTTQILIDSGAGDKVLDCLGRYMPFWDRQIELAISTHGDKDHSGGFVDVFSRYTVSKFLTNDLNNAFFGTLNIVVLRKGVGGSGTGVIYPNDLMTIRLGMIYLDVLHPTEGFSSGNTNDYSIVNMLRYGSFKAIFTGDIENNIWNNLIQSPRMQTVDYIKVSHHGSKNGTSEKLLQTLQPMVAVISVGYKNIYGHPNQEILDMLKKYNIKVLRTDELGDVDIETDGIKFWYNE